MEHSRAETPELIEAILHGQKDLYTLLVERYYSKTCKVIARYASDRHIIADIAQETFLQAYLNLSQLRDYRVFPGWLRKIAINMSLKYFRHRHNLSLNGFSENEVFSGSAIHDTEEHLITKEVVLKVRQALKKLTPEQRKVVILCYMYEFTYQQAAELLGIPLTAVRSRLTRARLNLSEQLRPLVTNE